MRSSILFLILLSLVPNYSSAQTPLDTLSLKAIFHEPFIPGLRPSFSHFSPDGKLVYFNWNGEAKAKTSLFKVDLKGHNVEKAPSDIQTRFSVSPNKKELVYSEKGDLIISDLSFNNTRTLVASKDFDFDPVWNKDGSKLAYVQDGDVWVIGVKEASIKQITKKKEKDPGFNIVAWTGDRKLVLNQWDNSEYKEYFFPEYVNEYVNSGSTKRGIPTNIISVANLDSGSVKEIFKETGWVDVNVTQTGQYVATDALDPAMKHRTISVFDLEADTSFVVFEDSTQGWIYGNTIRFSPSGNTLMFQSEKDGWNHIYTVNPDGTGLTQHTFSEYDIPWAEWLDSKTILIATNQYDRGDIQIYTLDIATNIQTQLTKDDGFRTKFHLSADRRYLVYSRSYFNQPFDLFALNLKKPKEEIQLTHSIPESFYDYHFQQEDYLHITARDGKTPLSVSILKPAKLNPKGNPVVVFVHGAGSLQNVYKGWSSSYWREYLFNQFLAAKGYYVLEVDYRHSTGYGRKFREDVANWMGKYETEDIQDGLAYLAGNYQNADTSRVGVYGGSYGGFMALYTVSVAPESFDAAAGLRSVTNWVNYYHTNPWYTLPRLGTPEADSINYARSSPITYADSLKKPILLLHGLIDNNVGFQDAAQYIDRLIQSGNENFEMMIYPTERHSFRDDDAWYDEYRRIFEFFEKQLQR